METRIKALIRLLSDPNKQVAKTIHDQLVRLGKTVLPYLKDAERQEPDLDNRLADVREEIVFAGLEEELRTLLAAGNIDLEAGAFLIAKLAYPELNVKPYRQLLDDMAEEVRFRIDPAQPIQSSMQELSRFLFKEKGFHGNCEEYYDPDNSFLNRVIDRRTGIPITLSVLYLLLGSRLDLPLAGVGMPGHFIVKVEAPSPGPFVDCFNGGIFLREEECAKFLIERGFGFESQHLEKIPNHMILVRMLRNLHGIYQNRNALDQTARVTSLIAVLETPVSLE